LCFDYEGECSIENVTEENEKHLHLFERETDVHGRCRPVLQRNCKHASHPAQQPASTSPAHTRGSTACHVPRVNASARGFCKYEARRQTEIVL
jgi:hypothetical protein